MCVCEYIKRRHNQSHKVLELILNCYELSKSIGHIGPPPSPNYVDY